MKPHGCATTFSAAITCAALTAILVPPLSHAQVSVLTHHNDNARTGQNLSETYLTPSVVNLNRFGKLFSQPLDGMAVAEPLYVPDLKINGKSHNVVFVVTLHDGVYAFDAEGNTGSNSSPLWYTTLIHPPAVTTVPIADQGCLGHNFTEMGILGTPVIDPSTETMYLVAKTLEQGKYFFRLHALNLQTGRENSGSPVVIEGAYTSNGELVTFSAQHRMNRPALLLSNGVIYVAFGTMGCKSFAPSTGWLMAHSASSLQQLGVLDVGPGQSATPGFWMGGDGPSVDSNGSVYVVTADGQFDYNVGGLDLGDTVLSVTLGADGLGLVDYFTPHDQAELDQRDLDLGSSGLVILPPQSGPYPNLGVLAGKQGMIYLINLSDLGGYNAAVDQVVQEVSVNPNDPPEVDGGATYWNQNLYFGGVGDGDIGIPIEMFSISDGVLSTTPVATTAKSYTFFSLFSISANGAQNGILWGVQQKSAGSTLNAFDATNLAPLYMSPQFDQTLHFVTPMIANGRVYVTTKDGLVVMGLLSETLITGGNKQSGEVGMPLMKPLSIKVVNAYTGAVMPGITVNFSDGGMGGSFSNPNPVTNSKGYAVTTYTLPEDDGVYRITATNAGLTKATFTETAMGAAVPQK